MRKEKLEKDVLSKLKVEGLFIGSDWAKIEACLSKTVLPKACLKAAEELRSRWAKREKEKVKIREVLASYKNKRIRVFYGSVDTGRIVLYQHPDYRLGDIEIVPVIDRKLLKRNCNYKVVLDGKILDLFSDKKKAENYVAFLKGDRNRVW